MSTPDSKTENEKSYIETSYTVRSKEVTPEGVRLYIQPKACFKGLSFERVPGIDYSQFEVSSFFIGALSAWEFSACLEWCPASDLFLPGISPMRVAYPPTSISLLVRGSASEFTITLCGREVW